jgi:hypothetical protein
MNISEACLFNKKFKSYKNHSHHEQPNIKRFLDEMTRRFSNDFSYYIINGYDNNIYIKSKTYSLYKIINIYRIFDLNASKHKYFFENMIKKNKIYNHISKYNKSKYKIKNLLFAFIISKNVKSIPEFYIFNSNNDKYFTTIIKFIDLNDLIIQTSYVIRSYYLKRNYIQNSLFYQYVYSRNYIYGMKSNSPFDDKYKFIRNSRICILFI